MKVRSGAAAAALAVANVSAQSAPAYGDAPVSYTTITVDTCTETALETMITVTNGVTVTYCPECEMGSSMPITTTPAYTGPGYTTTYTTTYLSMCPTGPTTATYTVTESCTDEKPTWTPGPSHIPNGFTTTEYECTVCGPETRTVTITEPCGCEATGGVPVPPKTTPVQQISDGQVQNPTPVQQISDGQVQNPTPVQQISDGQVQNPTGKGSPANTAPAATQPACDGEDCGGSGNQSPSSPASGSPNAPAYSSTTAQCPGPDCRAKVTQSPVASPGYSSGSGIKPYEGAASTSNVGVAASIVFSAIVAGLAFLL